MKKRVILCDFDGTLIEGNIENAFTSYLLKQKEIKLKLLSVALFTLPFNLLLNKLFLPSITKSWTLILRQRVVEYIDSFLDEYIERIKLKEDTIKLIDSLDRDELILLTGSYQQLVEAFIRRKNLTWIDKVIGTEVHNNHFTIKRHPFGKGKSKYVDLRNYNIGIANDYSDHFYLDICNEQYKIK